MPSCGACCCTFPGVTRVDQIKSALYASAQHPDNSSSGSEGAGPGASLGACLLQGCGLGLLQEAEADAMLQQWRDATASDRQDQVLQGFAPEWQLPLLPGVLLPAAGLSLLLPLLPSKGGSAPAAW